MNTLQTFQNPDFGEIRTVAIDDAPWFVGKDVAKALGYKNTKDVLSRHVDTEDKRGSCFPTPSGEQRMVIINESGLYSLILSSKLPAAKKFKRWVTSEVLPAIRRTGGYASQPMTQTLADFARRLEAIESKLNAPPVLPRPRRGKQATAYYQIQANPQFNSTEIHFDGKPSAAVRQALKNLRFRWYPAGGYWWGYAPEHEIIAAIEGAI